MLNLSKWIVRNTVVRYLNLSLSHTTLLLRLHVVIVVRTISDPENWFYVTNVRRTFVTIYMIQDNRFIRLVMVICDIHYTYVWRARSPKKSPRSNIRMKISWSESGSVLVTVTCTMIKCLDTITCTMINVLVTVTCTVSRCLGNNHLHSEQMSGLQSPAQWANVWVTITCTVSKCLANSHLHHQQMSC